MVQKNAMFNSGELEEEKSDLKRLSFLYDNYELQVCDQLASEASEPT